MRRTFLAVVCILFLATGKVTAQGNQISQEGMDIMRAMEDSLKVTADSMYNSYIPDFRTGYCQTFIRQLIKALKVPNSYLYPFDSIKHVINIISPDDNSFRIFNWQVITNEYTTHYYGAIQMPEEHLKLYPLVDCSDLLGKYAEDSILFDSKWFGAIYYRIITHTIDDKKVYTMLGKNESSPVSTKKVLDPLVFTDKGPIFGAYIFDGRAKQMPGMSIARFIIEYKKGVSASMNWDTDMQVIYFDRLASDVNDPNRKYTYVPSGQYDGFRWEHDQWQFKQDLIPVQDLGDGKAPDGQPAFNRK